MSKLGTYDVILDILVSDPPEGPIQLAGRVPMILFRARCFVHFWHQKIVSRRGSEPRTGAIYQLPNREAPNRGTYCVCFGPVEKE